MATRLRFSGFLSTLREACPERSQRVQNDASSMPEKRERKVFLASFLLLIGLAPLPCLAAKSKGKRCITPDQALQHVNKDVCVSAHVYTVVHAAQDTHFLDVCSPQTPDAACHFTIVSFQKDQKDVGNLAPLVNQNIQIRGTVRSFEGRAEIVLNRKQQLRGGKAKFHANPLLIQSFSAEHGGNAFSNKNGVSGQRGVHFHHGTP